MAHPLRTLMIGLFYPAFTGTAAVLVACRIALEPAADLFVDLPLAFGLLFLAWFSLSFVVIDAHSAAAYPAGQFVFDAVEVCLVFAMFFYLGLFDTNKVRAPNLPAMYACLVVAVTAQAFWRLWIRDSVGRVLWVLRGTLMLAGTLGSVHFARYYAFNLAALGALASVLTFYALLLRRRGIGA